MKEKFQLIASIQNHFGDTEEYILSEYDGYPTINQIEDGAVKFQEIIIPQKVYGYYVKKLYELEDDKHE